MLAIAYTIATSLFVTAQPIAPFVSTEQSTVTASASSINPTTPKNPVQILSVDPLSVLPGVTRARREVTIGTSFDSLLTEIAVTEGQRIQAGEIVAVLDDRVARAALEMSELEATHDAEVHRARAVFERARESLERTEAAYASTAVNGEQLSESRNRLAIASADLKMAEEVFAKANLQLELTRAQLEEHYLRAPVDSVVIRVHAAEGEVLSPGEPILELASTDRAIVDLYIPAAVGFSLHVGDRIALEAATPIEAVISASVQYVERRVDPISKTCRVRFEFEAPTTSVPAGVLITPASRVPTSVDETRMTALLGMTTEPVMPSAGAPNLTDWATASVPTIE